MLPNKESSIIQNFTQFIITPFIFMNNLLQKFILLSAIFCFFVVTIHAQVNIGTTNGFPIGVACNGVAYGNSVYVAVGASGYIEKSTDGTNWTVVKNSSFLNVTYNRVAFGNGLFAAVTADGKIVTSPDGTTWTQQTSGTTNFLNDIIYANSMFIAVGNSNTALTSANGTSWTAINTGAAALDNLMNVVYGSGKFVIGVRDDATSGSKVFYSTTGATNSWTGVTIANYASLNKVSFLNTTFYVFTSNTNIYTSTNLTTWSSVSNSRLTTPNQVFFGYYDGSKYYLFGSSQENGYGSVFTSTDGSTYSLQAQSTTIVAQYGAYLNGRYFQVGNEGLVSSSNGINWDFPAGSHNALAYSGTRYVAVGQATSTQGTIFTSTDWTSWSNALSTIIKPLNGVTYGGGKFVAVGNMDASGFGTTAYSADGVSWTIGNSGVADNLRAIAYGNSRYVAVGLNGRIVYSSNGSSWTSAESVSGYNYYGISYVNNYFVAVGGSITANTGQTKVKYSADGITWTDVSPSIIGHFHSIAYGGGNYVLVGRDNTTGTQKFFSVTTANITSAAGYSTAVTATTPDGDVGASGYGAVAYNNGNFLALVNLKATPFTGYVLTSTNAASWTATSANTTGRIRGLITQGTGFKVAGTSNTFLNINIGAPLPLKLVSFTGQALATSIQLKWKTEYEENLSGFAVERSTDGIKFYACGYIKATNKPGGNQYSYPDQVQPSGKIFYRLKMLDNNGRFSYSQVILIAAAKQNILSITPNPAKQFIKISEQNLSGATVRIFSQRGELVFKATKVNNNQQLDIQKLSAGVYHVQIENGAKIYLREIIKL